MSPRDAQAHLGQPVLGTTGPSAPLRRGWRTPRRSASPTRSSGAAPALRTSRPPTELVYAGFPPGVVSAQKLAQTRAGARGALLFYSCVPTSYFGPWPALLHPDAAALLTTRVLEYLGTR